MSESTQSRPQPPSIADPRSAETDLEYLGQEYDDDGPMPEQADDDDAEFEKGQPCLLYTSPSPRDS